MIRHTGNNAFEIQIFHHGRVAFLFNPAFFEAQNMNEQEAAEFIEDIFNTVISNESGDQKVFVHVNSIADASYSILNASDRNYIPPENWWDILGTP